MIFRCPDPAGMISRSTFFLLLTALLAGTGCDQREGPGGDRTMDGVYSVYSMDFDFTAGLTYARAEYRQGSRNGSLVRLPRRAQIAFNGHALILTPQIENDQYYFERNIEGYQERGMFRFTDGEDRTFLNESAMRHALLAQQGHLSLSTTVDNTLPLTGEPVAPGEAIHLVLRDRLSREEAARLTFTTPGTRAITIPAGSLSHLPMATYQSVVIREGEVPLQQPYGAGGHVSVRYHSLVRSITLYH
jgi:hypothetical protein